MKTYKTLQQEIAECSLQLNEWIRLANLHHYTDYYQQEISRRSDWLSQLKSELTMCEIRYFWAKKMKTLAAEI